MELARAAFKNRLLPAIEAGGVRVEPPGPDLVILCKLVDEFRERRASVSNAGAVADRGIERRGVAIIADTEGPGIFARDRCNGRDGHEQRSHDDQSYC